MKIEFSEEDMKLVFSTMEICKAIINTTAALRFPDDSKKEIVFIRTLLTNLHGNFILDLTSTEIPDALSVNIETTMNEFKTWFEKVEETKKEMKKGTH